MFKLLLAFLIILRKEKTSKLLHKDHCKTHLSKITELQPEHGSLHKEHGSLQPEHKNPDNRNKYKNRLQDKC